MLMINFPIREVRRIIRNRIPINPQIVLKYDTKVELNLRIKYIINLNYIKYDQLKRKFN
jgi:hypothetical protein